MAYTVDQSSGTGVQGAYDEIFYVVRDTVNYNAPKFRYIARVTIDGAVVGTFKQLPNNNNSAVFFIEQIVASYVHQDENVELLGILQPDGSLMTTKIFVTNQDAIKTVTVEFGYEKAADANSAPVETMIAPLATSLKVINGSLRNQTIDSNGTNAAGEFALSNPFDSLLATTTKNYVSKGQYGALAFLNGDDVGSDNCAYFHVTYYTAAGAAIVSGYFTNDTAQGGKAPAAGLTDPNTLLYIGCFPGNLEAQAIDTTIRPSNVSNWAYYELQAASSTTLAGNQASQAYKFYDTCKTRYNNIFTPPNKFPGQYCLSWWNNIGGVDNLILDGASKVMDQIKRETFYSIGGNAFNAGNTVDYNKRPSEGGTTSSGNQTTTSIILNTREHNPEMLNELMQSLASSPRVYVYVIGSLQLPSVIGKNSAYVRCVVSDISINYQTAINDKISSYSVTINISRRRPNNR